MIDKNPRLGPTFARAEICARVWTRVGLLRWWALTSWEVRGEFSYSRSRELSSLLYFKTTCSSTSWRVTSFRLERAEKSS